MKFETLSFWTRAINSLLLVAMPLLAALKVVEFLALPRNLMSASTLAWDLGMCGLAFALTARSRLMFKSIQTMREIDELRVKHIMELGAHVMLLRLQLDIEDGPPGRPPDARGGRDGTVH